ncbi:MAG: type II secretion system protein N [Chromatiales bacterium]|nr:type II secretion system protein N [Chromatiales bacterium]
MKAVAGTIGALLALYLLALIVTFPVERAYGWLRPQLRGIEIYGLSGTVWAGQAQQVMANGIELPPVRWQWRPAGLLDLALEYDVRLGSSPLTGTAVVGVNWQQQPVLHSLDMPAAMLAPYLGPLAPPLGGRLRADADRLNLQEPLAVDGQIHWTGAGLGWEPPVMLGDIDLVLKSEDGGVRGDLSNEGGDVGAEGVFALVGNGIWNLKGSLRPRDAADRRLSGLLNNLGRPDGQGGVIFQQQGRLSL